MMLPSPILAKPEKPEVITVVRIRTSSYHDDKGVYFRKNMTFLKRKCKGNNCVLEDCDYSSADYVIPRIVNFYNCQDGVYEIQVNDIQRDWETGYVDDWDYILVPYEETPSE